MQFQPGQSGNPGGRSKKSWIKDRERMWEAKRTWKLLLKLRDGMILERKEIGKDPKTGEPIMADVVPSARDLIACCKEILNRAVGMPSQEVDLQSTPRLTVLVRTIDPDTDRDSRNDVDRGLHHPSAATAPEHAHDD